jgi:hypothetical protein
VVQAVSLDYKDCTYRMRDGLEVAAGCPVNTDPWPTIIESDKGLYLVPTDGAHLARGIGYWGWFLAGELFTSSFTIWPKDPERTERNKEQARVDLIRFANKVVNAGRQAVEAEMAANGRLGKSVGVTGDNELFPTPQDDF